MKIKEFTISDGNLPIANYVYRADKIRTGTLIGYNRIKSRDGGLQFPKGFFDSKTIKLNRQQEAAIKKILKTIHLSEWNTNYAIVENVGAAGFCIETSFSCKFTNGKEFFYYPSSGTQPEEFKQLMQLLKTLCPLPDYSPGVDFKRIPNQILNGIKVTPGHTQILTSEKKFANYPLTRNINPVIISL